MATLQEFAAEIGRNLPEMVELFADVATQDPLSAVSVLVGAAFVVGASVALAYFAVGAGLDLLGAGTAR